MLGPGIKPCFFRVAEPRLVGSNLVVLQTVRQGVVELRHEGVHLLVDLKPQIVAEIILPSFHQKRLRCGRIGEACSLPAHQPEARQCGQECCGTIKIKLAFFSNLLRRQGLFGKQ